MEVSKLVVSWFVFVKSTMGLLNNEDLPNWAQTAEHSALSCICFAPLSL
jgi:hypothetical protein